MPIRMVLRAATIGGALAALAACTSTTPPEVASAGDSLATPPPSVTAPTAEPGQTEARFCPQVSLREGTSILRKKVSSEIDYVASISDTTRDCHIVDGKLRMEVGVRGRVTPGPVAQQRSVQLPIRIAILRGTDVLYSKLGKISVAVDKNAGTQTFTYVDRDIVLDAPKQPDVVAFAGFDEGPPE